MDLGRCTTAAACRPEVDRKNWRVVTPWWIRSWVQTGTRAGHCASVSDNVATEPSGARAPNVPAQHPSLDLRRADAAADDEHFAAVEVLAGCGCAAAVGPLDPVPGLKAARMDACRYGPCHAGNGRVRYFGATAASARGGAYHDSTSEALHGAARTTRHSDHNPSHSSCQTSRQVPQTRRLADKIRVTTGPHPQPWATCIKSIILGDEGSSGGEIFQVESRRLLRGVSGRVLRPGCDINLNPPYSSLRTHEPGMRIRSGPVNKMCDHLPGEIDYAVTPKRCRLVAEASPLIMGLLNRPSFVKRERCAVCMMRKILTQLTSSLRIRNQLGSNLLIRGPGSTA